MPSKRSEALFPLIVVLLVLSLGFNVWAFISVRRLSDDVSRLGFLSGQVSGLSAQVSNLERQLCEAQEPKWAVLLDESIAAAEPAPGEPANGSGFVTVTLTFSLLEVDPGSKVSVVILPAEGETPTSEVAASDLGGLNYTASFDLDPGVNWRYRIMGRVGGAQRASEVRSLDLAEKLGRSVLFVKLVERGSGRHVFVVWQEPVPLLQGYRVDDIDAMFVIEKSGREAFADVVSEGDGWTITVTDDEPGDLFLTVTYANGETTEVSLPPLTVNEAMGAEIGG